MKACSPAADQQWLCSIDQGFLQQSKIARCRNIGLVWFRVGLFVCFWCVSYYFSRNITKYEPQHLPLSVLESCSEIL